MMPVDRIPIRLTPLPGEALDSYLETYAERLHVRLSDIFDLAGLTAQRSHRTRVVNNHKPWMFSPDPAELDALSAVTGLPPDRLTEMTLARYAGTGLAAVDAATGSIRSGRWWRQMLTSRFCPCCLAEAGGRWLLAWRLPWSFACTRHQVLLADLCPTCQRPHRWTRNQPPRHGEPCRISSQPLPSPSSRRGTPSCTQNLAEVDPVALPASGRVLDTQQHLNTVIVELVNAHGRGANLTGLQGYLDDVHTAAHAALSALRVPVPRPDEVTAALAELGIDPGRPRPAGVDSAATMALTHPAASGTYRQHASVVAFGMTVADLMLHARRNDPDPTITAWLVDAAFPQSNQARPASLLRRWISASRPVQAAVLKPLGARLSALDQLRYNTATPTPGRPPLRSSTTRAAAVPALFWPGWALRLMPPNEFVMLPYRSVLSVLLLIAGTEETTCAQAQQLLGHTPTHATKFSVATQRLRHQGVLDNVLSALGQLARHLDEHGAPIDYARRRRLRRFTHARLDIDAWRRRRLAVTLPDNWDSRLYIANITPNELPADPRDERFARLHLIELLTGTHPYWFPEPLRLPTSDSNAYARFVFTLPAPLSAYLHQQAQNRLVKAGIHEQVCWEPPFDWVTDITWPGPHPDDISPDEMWALIQDGHPLRATATKLGTTIDHLRLTASRHPPRQPSTRSGELWIEEDVLAPPDTNQLRAFAEQGLGPRKIAQLTGYSQRLILQLLIEAGLTQTPITQEFADNIDPAWLQEQYEIHQRSFNNIAAELGIDAVALVAHARKIGIAIRPGVLAHQHPLADLGRPDAFPPAIWAAFFRPAAEQRIRRFLQTPGHPSLSHAAKHLGIRTALLNSQITQLEQAIGATLLQPAADQHNIALTAEGEQFARDVRPVLEILDSSRNADSSPQR